MENREKPLIFLGFWLGKLWGYFGITWGKTQYFLSFPVCTAKDAFLRTAILSYFRILFHKLQEERERQKEKEAKKQVFHTIHNCLFHRMWKRKTLTP